MLEGGTETMSSKIDQRIVEMSFENHKFEEGIKRSKKSLKEFSNALEGMGTGKDFKGLERSIESTSSSFSLLEQVGIGALRRIGEAALNAGTQLLKSLTVDPLSSGWTKYEQKTASVQTIMNATGKSIDEVNGYLDKLMWFSDETSYGFTDMTAALAQMTSSGGNIDTLIPLITGVANATAYAGKGAAEFSRAMYNLNQSYGMGNLQFMDWRSLELAGVAGKELKQIFIDTGKALGTLDKAGRTAKGTLVNIGTFGASLQDKWADTRVMEAAFGKFSELSEAAYELVNNGTYDTAAEAMDFLSGKYSEVAEKGFKSAQQAKSFSEAINATLDAVSSGWMRTYEIIFGYLPEATKNFSALTEMLWTAFASGAEGRNEMLQMIKDAGGITSAFKSLKNIGVALLKPLRAVSQAFDQFFPPRTKDQWMGIINAIESVTSKFIITDETADKLRRTFAGFFAVVDTGWQGIKFLGRSLAEIVRIFIPFGGNLLDMTATLGDYLVVINHIIKQSGIFQYALLGVKVAAVLIKNTVGTVVAKVAEFVHTLMTVDKPLEFLAKKAKTLFSGVIASLQTGTKWISGKFLKALTGVQKFFDTKFDIEKDGAIGTVLQLLKDFVTFLAGGASGTLFSFGEALKNLDFRKITTFVTGGILLLFINQLSNLTKVTADLVASTNGFVSKLTKRLFGTQIKIKEFAVSIAIMTTSLVVLSQVPWEKLKVGLGGLAGAMLIFVGAYGAINAMTVMASKKIGSAKFVKTAFDIVALAGGLAAMAGAVKIISTIDETAVWRSVGVVAAMAGIITGYQLISTLISLIPGTRSASAKLTGMASGLLGMVAIVTILNFISPAQLGMGLAKLAILMSVLSVLQAVFVFASRLSGGKTASVKLLGVSLGILSLLGVMKLLEYVSPHDIVAGAGNLFLMGGLLAAIQLMFNVAGRIGGGLKFKTNIFSMQMGLVSMIVLASIMGKPSIQKNLQNGIKNLAKMAAIIGGLEIITGLAARLGGGFKIQKILGSVTLTLTSFTVLIGVLNMYTQETIDAGIANIIKMAKIIVQLQIMTTLIGLLRGPGQGAATVVGLVTLLLTITASLALLSNLSLMDPNALDQAVRSLAISVGAVTALSVGTSAMLKALSVMSSNLGAIKVLVKNIIPGFIVLGSLIIGTLAMLGMLQYANSTLEGVSWGAMAKFTAGLVIVGGLVIAFSKFGQIAASADLSGLKGLIPGLASMTITVLATAGMFYLINASLEQIKDVSWSNLGKFVAGLGVITLLSIAMIAASPFLIAMGPFSGPALTGALTAIGGVAMVVGAFVGLASVMEGLFGDDTAFLVNGIDKLVEVGRGIGRFIGAIAGGFSSELLIGYGEGIAGFAEQINSIDSSSFEGVESLARAMLVLTSGVFLDGLNRLLGFKGNPGDLFGKQLRGLIDALKIISIDDATNASKVITALAPMVENLKKLADAAKSIPNSGGFLGAFMGENDVSDFGNELKFFINNLKSIPNGDVTYSATVLEALIPMAENLKIFAKAAKSIPNSGGFLEDFLGNNDVSNFGYMIQLFVYHLGNVPIIDAIYASNVIAALVPMAENLTIFAEAADKIPETGGWAGVFAGDNDINTFAEKIKETITSFASIDQTSLGTANSNVLSMSRSLLPGLERFVTMASRFQSNSDGGRIPPQFTSLTTLARQIKDLVKILEGVDVSVIAPAFNSLDTINAAFRIVGKDIIDSAVTSIQNNTPLFQTEIIKLLDTTTKTVQLKRGDIGKSFGSLMDIALITLRAYVDDFRVVGGDIVRGLQNGIDGARGTAVKAANNMAKSVITSTTNRLEVRSPSKVFEGIGAWLPAGLGVGIERNSKVAILASANMASGVEAAVRDGLDIHSIGNLFPSIGSWIPPGISAGINSAKDGLLKIASNLGIDTSNMTIGGITSGLTGGEGAITSGINSLLELLTGKTTVSDLANSLGSTTGASFADGYAAGVGGSSAAASKAYSGVATDAFQAFKESIDKRREYNQITTWQEIQAWEEFAKRYKKGTEMRMKIDKEVGRLRYEYAKTWIDEEKYYKRLSLDEELSAWERIQARYEAGHEYRLQAEREVFRLKQEIWQAEYDHALEYIDDEKYYGRMDLSEELNEWKKLYNFTTEGTDERKKAEREIFRLENEIRDTNLEYEEKLREIEKNRHEERLKLEEEYYEKAKEVNDKLARDIQSLNDEYNSALESRTNSLYSAYGLFDKVEKPEYISSFQLINNLEEQNTAFDKWQSSIGALAAKGVDEGLIKELRDMGPKSLAQINALNRLSDSELSRYVDLWQKKSQEAKDQATSELAGLKTENEATIIQMTDDAQVLLDGYEAAWLESLAQLDVDTNAQLDQLQTDWVGSIGGMTDTGIELIKKFKLDWFGEIANIVANTNTQMTELKKATENIKPAAQAVASVIDQAMSSGTSGSGSNSTKAKAETIGKNIVSGIASGIKKSTPTATKATYDLNDRIYSNTNTFWMIKSPSRKSMEIGKFIVLGMADGLKQFAGAVTNEGNHLGQSALDALSAPLDSIPDLLSNNVGDFKITPVLDLTDVDTGLNGLNSIINGKAGLDLTNTMRLLPQSNQTNQNGILSAIRDGLLSMTNPEVDLSGKLTVEVVNDKGEIVGIAETAIKDLLRRESR